MDQDKPSCGELCKNYFYYHWRGVISLAIPLVFAPILAIEFNNTTYRCLYAFLVIAAFWIIATIPYYITGLIPIVALPVLGILASDKTCKLYFSNVCVMCLGGIFLSLAVEQSNLHRRLALHMMLLIGCSPRRLHLGLIVVTTVFSFFTFNTASSTMMCPIVRSVLEEMETQSGVKAWMDEEGVTENERHPSKIGVCFYLSVAYAATIGGCATIIGSEANLGFKGVYEKSFSGAPEVTFLTFMAYNMPWVILDTIILYIVMEIVFMGLFRPNSATGAEIAAGADATDKVAQALSDKKAELGKMSIHEIQVLILVIMLIFLLLTISPGFVEGWGDFLNDKEVQPSAAVMLVAFLAFYLPMSYAWCRYFGGSGPFTNKEVIGVLSWKFLSKYMSWGILFLLGGGCALAEGIHKSGLGKMFGNYLKGCGDSSWQITLLGILLATCLTTFTNHTAIVVIITPVLAEMAKSMEIHPLSLMLPVAMGCSIGFFLPISSGPNALIACYANIKTHYVLLAGILPTLSTIFLLWLNGLTWHYVIFPDSSFPEWAKPKPVAPVVPPAGI